MVKPAGLVFCIFYLTEHQTGLSALLSLFLSLSPSLPLSACSYLAAALVGSSRWELRPHSTCWYIGNRRMSHLSRLCSLACLAANSPHPPCSCCHLYIPFLIKVDKCPPPSPSLLSTVIEQLLKIDYENRLLKFFMHRQANELSRNWGWCTLRTLSELA